MTAVINFTPLYGTDEYEPFCYLLQIDTFTILLDCGWDESFDENKLQALKQVIPDIDCVLLSFPDISHLGALPYAIGRLGLNCPIYGTLPVYKMGQMFLYDAYQSRSRYEFNVFNLDDVDTAFEKFIQLKYSQEIPLTGKGEGIVITPYAAGHMIGGTMWKITKETEEILYAVDFNHSRERHLEGTVLETFSRPTVLITDAYNILTKSEPRRTRDDMLFDLIVKTLGNNGNVLLPTDAAGRALELLLLLHSHWEANKWGTNTYSLALLSNVAFNTVDFAQQQIEWMSLVCQKRFNLSRSNPFSLKNLHLCHSKDDLDKLKQPYVCIATSYTLEPSFAQDVFLEISAEPKNLVIFTERAAATTLAGKLQAIPTPSRVTFSRYRNVLLEGKELEDYTKEQKQNKQRKEMEKKEIEMDDSDSDLDDDVLIGSSFGGRSANKLTASYPMFPYVEKKRTWDIYGETIQAADFNMVEKETGVAPVEQAMVVDIDAVVEEEEEKKEEIAPHKVVVENISVNVACSVQYIDFEGRSDGKSIRTILTHVAPRRLILVHGSTQCKEELADCMRKDHVCKDVSIPTNGQCVDITSETNIYRVHLKDALTQKLEFVKIGDYDIAFADCEMKINYDESPLPVLRPAPKNSAKGHPAVFLGNLKFSDLKKVLNKKGIQADFYDGVLVCSEGLVNIEKVSPTQISIKGALSEEYFEIRKVLYGLYEIL